MITCDISCGGKDAPTSADVARGKYLVEEIAKCAECHTPRDGRGELKQSAWLRGASIWIEPVTRIANWADSAPPLAGLPIEQLHVQKV